MAAIGDEYRAAREGAAVAVLDRRLLAVSGPLRQKFLHNLLSHDVLSLQPGQTRLATLLDVKGHLVATLRVVAIADALLLELPAERVDAVHKALVHYKVGTPVRFAEPPSAVLAVLGPRAAATLAAAAGATVELSAGAAQDAAIAGHAVRIVRAPDVPADGFVVHAAPDTVDAVRAALHAAGAVPIGGEALDVLRIEDGTPWYGADVTEQNLLHETGLVAEYASTSKGCYVGQEVVARLTARGGNVSKALRGLALSAPVEAGAAVTADGKDVGRVTTAGVSPARGAIAMAYIHRSRFDPGTAVEVGTATGTVTTLPMTAPAQR